MLEDKPHAEPGNRLAPQSGLEPVGIEGCMTCASLARSRELAREAGVPQAVAGVNREIGNRPHYFVGKGRKLPATAVWGVVA
ncbi:hypothetical protein [Streptomyces sp. bgisy095]|uniref:hypothetical protein n=1 Tax=unclassified Streptomyces TaxID=2593676 RepID=UPI003D70CE34